MNTIEQSRTFSRRDLLQGTLAIAVGKAFAPFEIPSKNIASCAVSELDNVDVAEQDPTVAMQNKLFIDTEIVAITPRVAYELTKAEIGATKNPLQMQDPRAWNLSNLSLLYNAAIQLPKHITQSHEGEYVQIAIENLKESACACSGVTYTDNDPSSTHAQDVIWMDSRLFVQERNVALDRELMEYLGHETVGHRYIQDVLKGEPLKAIEDIFGKDIEVASMRVGKVLLRKDFDSLTPLQVKGFNLLNFGFATDNGFGTKLTDYREAGAYLSQLYLYGPESWENGIEPFLGKRVTGALYDIFKDVFQMEYQSFPQICPS
jgi:hypothetical protein